MARILIATGWALLGATVGCADGHFEEGPGRLPCVGCVAGGQGGGVLPDAASPTPTLRGRVCARTDVFEGAACGPIDSAKLIVTVVETQEKTAVDREGNFELPAPTGVDRVRLVTNPDDVRWFPGALVVDLKVPSANPVALPVVPRAHIEELISANQVAADPKDAILVVHVLDGQRRTNGARLSPILGTTPFYDTTDPPLLAPDGSTGPQGTAVYFGLPATAATFTVTPPSGIATAHALPLASPAIQFHEATF